MYKLIRDSIHLTFASIIDPEQPIFVDTETTEDEGYSTGGLYGKIRLVQIYQAHWQGAVIIDCQFVPLSTVLSILKPHHLVFHNAAFDLHTINLKTSETWLPKDVGDTMYLSRLKWWTKEKFGFYNCLEYASLDDDLINSIDKKAEQKSDWSGPLTKRQLTYAACDVAYLAELWEEVKEYQDQTVYQLDIENLKLAIEYTRNGLPVNQKTVQQLRLRYTERLEDALEKLPINPRSSVQARNYLGSSSSDSDTLTRLIQQGDKKAELVREGRHCYKSLEYLNAYDRPIIRGFFQPCTSLSGRFSCTGGNNYNYANLQQMPESLHCVVEAPKGWSIIYKDYSGLELRMAVAYTGEAVMAHMYKAGLDMHTETAKYIFSKNDVTTEERVVAKTFNFCLIYGGGAATAQSTLQTDANMHLPIQEVQELRLKWFDMYEYYKEWHNMHKKQMNIYGYCDVETALGRKVRAYRLTDSLNIPIQGSSVEVTKSSLAILKRKHKDAIIINTIHDSNLLMAKEDEAKDWGQALSDAMVEGWQYVIEDLADPDIPMPGGYEYGPVWKWH